MSEQNKIDEIKARHSAATKGPWKFKLSSHEEYGLYGAEDRVLSFGGRSGYEEYRGQEPGLDDEVFLDSVWQDMAYLLAEIEELRNAIDKPRADLLFRLHNERTKKEEALNHRDMLLVEIERKDEALNEIELILTDDISTKAIEINQTINRAREAL